MSNRLQRAGLATRAIHCGNEPESVTGAIIPPIFQTLDVCQETVGHR